MSAAQIVVFPRGQLSADDRDRMTAAGFCVVEADDPKAVVTHVPSAPLVTANQMLLCALKAMDGPGSNGERSRFTELLTVAMSKASEA